MSSITVQHCGMIFLPGFKVFVREGVLSGNVQWCPEKQKGSENDTDGIAQLPRVWCVSVCVMSIMFAVR